MSHDGKYAITPNNGDETISIIDLKSNTVAATLEAGPNMTGVNFAAGKAFVISSTSGFVYVYDMSSLKPAGRIKMGTNIQLETATTDTKDEKLYLAESTNHEVIIIDAKTQRHRAGEERGPVPVGNAYHGQQGQLLPLIPAELPQCRPGPVWTRLASRVHQFARRVYKARPALHVLGAVVLLTPR